MRPRVPRAVWLGLGLPLAVYLVVEWLFAYVTLTDGLVTPHGAPKLGVVGLGIVYLILRIGIRLLLPGIAVVALARALGAPRESRA